MKWLCDASEFVRRIRWHMRFGELSRVPLRLLRLELRAPEAKCEWIVRPNDPWDEDLPTRSRQRNQTEQALRDAIKLRELLFASLPEIHGADVEAYRLNQDELELLISGRLDRNDIVVPRIASLRMRAQLYGFRFCLEDGKLLAMQSVPGKSDFSGRSGCECLKQKNEPANF